MAGKFKIYVEQKGESVHIVLEGDFDGSSACQLSNVLSEKLKGVHKVVIHTDNLKSVHPFGRSVLERNLSFLKRRLPIRFEGRRARLF